MNEFTRTLLDTDGQTLVNFILFCKRVNCTPNEDAFNWFKSREASNTLPVDCLQICKN